MIRSLPLAPPPLEWAAVNGSLSNKRRICIRPSAASAAEVTVAAEAATEKSDRPSAPPSSPPPLAVVGDEPSWRGLLRPKPKPSDSACCRILSRASSELLSGRRGLSAADVERGDVTEDGEVGEATAPPNTPPFRLAAKPPPLFVEAAVTALVLTEAAERFAASTLSPTTAAAAAAAALPKE